MPQSGMHRMRYNQEDGSHSCKNCGIDMSQIETLHEKGYRVVSFAHAGEPCPKASEPWDYMRINRSFMSRLRETFGTRPFTNKAAYQVYATHHAVTYIAGEWCKGFGDISDPFLQMQVRDNLCASAYRGEIIRLGPGKYQFPPTAE